MTKLYVSLDEWYLWSAEPAAGQEYFSDAAKFIEVPDEFAAEYFAVAARFRELTARLTEIVEPPRPVDEAAQLAALLEDEAASAELEKAIREFQWPPPQQ